MGTRDDLKTLTTKNTSYSSPCRKSKQFLGRPVRSQVTIPISVSRLQYGQHVVPKDRPTATNSKYLNFERSFLESTGILKCTLNENRQDNVSIS